MLNKFSLTQYQDERISELIQKGEHKILAKWAYDCAKRALPYFETQFPDDPRPRQALQILKDWIKTGEFHMKTIRTASLDSHAAARLAPENSPARSAARACGQAVATAHVKTHSLGAAIYALQAIHRATNTSSADSTIYKECNWQYQHLLDLKKRLSNEYG